ncbi:CCR4-NOT transcription complex subunit 8 [Homalodisca vitripennis]|nr:CCR4-NOT transcription complex subunit 8 [Homalodisca vitripennis]
MYLHIRRGYDVLYLLKMVGPGLQYDKRVFNEVVSHYFPIILDVKYLSAWVWGPEATRKGLQRIADILQVPRIGKQHQAGSDSHLTGQVFFVILYTFLTRSQRCLYASRILDFGAFNVPPQVGAVQIIYLITTSKQSTTPVWNCRHRTTGEGVPSVDGEIEVHTGGHQAVQGTSDLIFQMENGT